MIRTGLFEKLDRIEELNQRTNQLNYTKVRLSREELEEMILDETIDTGYVEVKDNYGDYGIIGFFALKDNCLLQFYFSCRTLGLGGEQWVYAQLKFPKVKTVGEFDSQFNYLVNGRFECHPECSEILRGSVDTQMMKKDIWWRNVRSMMS